MSESTALLAARQGRNALEAFQRANPGSMLDFRDIDFRDPQNEDIEFSGFEFLLDVDFSRAKFADTPIPWSVHGYRPPTGPGPVRGAALFQKSVFHGRASFDHASFGHKARFDDSIFKLGSSSLSQAFLSRRAAQRRIVDHRVRHRMHAEQFITKFLLPVPAQTIETVNRFQQLGRIERRAKDLERVCANVAVGCSAHAGDDPFRINADMKTGLLRDFAPRARKGGCAT